MLRLQNANNCLWCSWKRVVIGKTKVMKNATRIARMPTEREKSVTEYISDKFAHLSRMKCLKKNSVLVEES